MNDLNELDGTNKLLNEQEVNTLKAKIEIMKYQHTADLARLEDYVTLEES